MHKKEVQGRIVNAVDSYLQAAFRGTKIHRKGYVWSVGDGDAAFSYSVGFPDKFFSPTQMTYFTIAFSDTAGKIRPTFFKVPTQYRKKMVDNYCDKYRKAMEQSGVRNFKVSALKKFAIRSRWGKEEIHFQDLAELDQLLRILVPISVEKFAKLAR